MDPDAPSCLGDCAVAVEWKAHEGKVFSLTWASSTSVSVHNPERPSASPYAILFTCGPDGRLVSGRNKHAQH